MLHVGRIDIHPGRDDQVFLPIDNPEEPICVAGGEIAGEEPAIAQGDR